MYLCVPGLCMFTISAFFLTKFTPYLRDNRKKGQGVNFAQKSWNCELAQPWNTEKHQVSFVYFTSVFDTLFNAIQIPTQTLKDQRRASKSPRLGSPVVAQMTRLRESILSKFQVTSEETFCLMASGLGAVWQTDTVFDILTAAPSEEQNMTRLTLYQEIMHMGDFVS